MGSEAGAADSQMMSTHLPLSKDIPIKSGRYLSSNLEFSEVKFPSQDCKISEQHSQDEFEKAALKSSHFIHLMDHLLLSGASQMDKESACNVGGTRDSSLIPEWGKSPGGGPGESHVQRSLVGYSPWGRKESGMTEGLSIVQHSS